MKIENNTIHSWISSLSSVKEYDGSFINIIYYDRNNTFIELDSRTKYIAATSSCNTIDTVTLTDSLLSVKEDNFEEDCFYFFTVNLQQTVMGKISSSKLIERVINCFIDSFGFMKMDVHVIERVFKSSGDVQVSVVVANTINE